MRLLVFAVEEEWLDAAELEFLEAARRVREAGRKSCHFCLAGGNTPGALYRRLAASARAEEAFSGLSMHLWLGDERAVETSSDARNGRMIEDSFRGAVWPFILHLWPASNEPALYDASLASDLGPRPAFDLALLGLGADGHTASLFPGDTLAHAAIDEADRADEAGGGARLAAAQRPLLAGRALAPTRPRERMSLTPAALRGALSLRFLSRGVDKLPVARALAAGGSNLPAALLDSERAAILHLER